MAKKKGKKGKAKKSVEEKKTYTFLTIEEWRARETRNNLRLNDVKDTQAIISDAFVQVDNNREKKRLNDKWNAYINCDDLPKEYSAADIRTFFEKMCFFEANDVEMTIDWALNVDERSILTQDIFRTDKTRRTLVQKIRPDLGGHYQICITKALKILKNIDYFLDNKKLTLNFPSRLVKLVIEEKKNVQQEIRDLFDRYTYRIISSENSFMDTVSAIISEYAFIAKTYEIHIWTLKNVPIIFQQLDEPNLRAHLHALKVDIQLPFNILEEQLTLRGIHFEFDHFSEHAKSFYSPPLPDDVKFIPEIADHLQSLTNEWQMQLDIQQEVKNLMLQKRLDYERLAAQIEELTGKQSKNARNEDKSKKGKDKAPKIPKLPAKEPPIVDPNSYPEVLPEVLHREQSNYDTFNAICNHPDALNLDDKELNLKKFVIAGGIYQLFFVTKPLHYDFTDKFNMTWITDKGKLTVKNIEPIDPTVLPSRDSKIFRHSSTLTESSFRFTTRLSHASRQSRRSRLSFRERQEDPDSPYYILEFELPKYLCEWGDPPVACHFELDVIGYIEKILEPEPTESVPEVKRKKTSTFSRGSVNSDAVSAQTNPQLPVQETAEEIEAKKFQIKKFDISDIEIAVPPVECNDFYLDYPLTKNQIAHIKEHCVPRIVSSYRFPKELKDEEDFRTKNKKMALVVRNVSLENILTEKVNDKIFRYDDGMQTNPERIFPIFPSCNPIERVDYNDIAEVLRNSEPETFYDLLVALDDIKDNFRRRYQKTGDVPQFVLKYTHSFITHMIMKEKRISGTKKFRISRTSLISGVEGNLSERRVSGASSTPRSIMGTGSIRKSKRLSSTNTLKKSISSVTTQVIPDIIEEEECEEEEEGEQYDDVYKEYIEEKDTRESFKFSRWTTEHIRKSFFDREACRMTIYTDRLGIIGFATKRYLHFPFKYWSVEPYEFNPENEVVFTLETQHAKFVIIVTHEGYKGFVTEPTKAFLRNRIMYLEFPEPINDIKELKSRLCDKNLNIFAQQDGGYYIKNGYFSVKHMSTEMHTYSSIALNCNFMKFERTEFNCLALRRDILLRLRNFKDPDDTTAVVRITPEETTFVEIQELCTEFDEVTKLAYHPTWRNIDFYADLTQAINSFNPAAPDIRCKNANVIWYLKKLLCETRILSFS